MTTLAVEAMTRRLTDPFRQGASILALSLIAAQDATQAQVAGYDFSEYLALYNRLPKPRYILISKQDISVATQVTIDYAGNSPATAGSVTTTIPAGTLAGTSLALDLNGHTEAEIRIQRVHMSPPAADGEAANWWGLVALLGELAKLLWVLGWERDHISRHLSLVQTQHHLPQAIRFSLDLLGNDLGVPRFPPQPYSFDPDTIALYHLDDQPASGQPEVDQVEDSMKRYPGKTDHSGANSGRLAKSGATGRFGSAFAFDNQGAEILIPSHPEFDILASDSFTIECFVKPSDSAVEGDLLARSPNPTATGQVGWALSVGSFGRGLPLNVRFLVNDGTTLVTLFADQSLTTDRFYHLAGVIDRGAGEVSLYIDGQRWVAQSVAGLKAIGSAEPVRIGRSPVASYRGLIDEVRFSRVARTAFHPVLGEDDESYRHRLEVFEKWTLPTLPALVNMLNEAVGSISGDPSPLILNDVNTKLVDGTLALTVQPAALQAGECMDAEGNRRAREADVNGTIADEPAFDPLYLVTHNDPRVTYSPPPPRTLKQGELPLDTHKMQAIARFRLNQLLDLLDQLGAGGQLQLLSAFDPRASDLRAVGRGLLFSHSVLPLSKLAALAHQAGFSFVCNNADAGAVYTSTEQGNYIDVVVVGGTATSANGFTMRVNETLSLQANPPLPPDTFYSWLMIPCGAGQASFTTPDNLPTVTLNAQKPGSLTIKVEGTHRQSTVTGLLTIRIGPLDLDDGATIGDDGMLGISESVVDEADDFFHPSYLVTHNDARATYGTDINNRRMQPQVARCLNRLLDLLAAGSVAGQLQIVQAYVPGASGLPAVGRAITFEHSTLAAGALGVLAHAAGFNYVQRQGNQILARQQPGELVTITGITGPQEVLEGAVAHLAVQPQALPSAIASGGGNIYTANSGTDTVSEIDPSTGSVKRAIKVGWGPGAITLSPDGKRIYTADSQGNTITAVDQATGTIAGSLVVSRNPLALVHHPANPRLYVVCRDDNVLLEIDDSATLTLLNTLSLPAGSLPSDLAITPDGSSIWIALSGTSQVALVNTNSNPLAVSGNLALTQAPLKIAISPDGKQAYATQPGNGSVVIIDTSTHTISQPIHLGPAALASSPYAVTVAPDNSIVYVTDTIPGNERVHLLKADGTEIMNIRARKGIQDVIATSGHAYVVNRDSDYVNVIDPIEQGITDTWRLGSGLGEALTWVSQTGGAATVRLSSTTVPPIDLSAIQAGNLLVRAVYELRDNPEPYTFEIRLKPALEVLTGAQYITIRKEQYDIIMNILNAFHPIGIEVITRAIRERVIEVRDQLLNAFPAYTYPNFRVRSFLLSPRGKE